MNGAHELRLDSESIEALATRVGELLGDQRLLEASLPQKLTAGEVARWWGIERSWVYSHAAELGARRLGSGPRPRLRFDADEVAEALGSPTLLPGARLAGVHATRPEQVSKEGLRPDRKAEVAEVLPFWSLRS